MRQGRADRRHRDGEVLLPGALRRARRATIDADLLAREAVAPGSPGLAGDRRALRPWHPACRMDRSIVRRSGGSSSAARGARAELEAIVHPRVYRRIDAWFANLPLRRAIRPRRHSAALRDRPRPRFRRGRGRRLRAGRAAAPAHGARRPVDADARARLAAQWPIDEKVRRADHVIWTDGTLAETDARVRAVFESLSIG